MGIEGLQGAVELNGKAAVVKSFNETSGRYVVEIDGSSEQKSLKRENLNAATVVAASRSRTSTSSQKEQAQKEKDRSAASASTTKDLQAKVEKKSTRAAQQSAGSGGLEIGDRVRVGGLNGAVELNGRCAVVFSYDKQAGRYLVEFENGAGQKKLKIENLTPMGTSNGALSAKARMLAGL